MSQLHRFKLQKSSTARKRNGSTSQEALRAYRRVMLENQTQFWARFGVTQSRGSRFESGMEIPPPVAILLRLYFNGVINDGDLLGAQANSEFEPNVTLRPVRMDKSCPGG